MQPAAGPARGLALVMGASRGLGLLIARELLDRGHDVVITARGADGARGRRPTAVGHGVVRCTRASATCATGRPSCALVEEVEDTLAPIDVLISVAGIIEVGPAEAMTAETYDDAIDTMTRGPIHAALAVLPGMRRRGRGRIGTVTSIGGMVSPPHLLPYATAKFGAVGFSDGLAAALSGTGVTATTVVPGLMRTGSHQRARFSGDAAGGVLRGSPPPPRCRSCPWMRTARRGASSQACSRGRPMVVLTPVGVGRHPRARPRPRDDDARHGLGRSPPAGTSRRRGGRHAVEGRDAAAAVGDVVRRLTTLGDRAARRNNEVREVRVAEPVPE